MATFQDKHGRSWDIELTVQDIKRVSERTGVYLGTCLQDEMRPLTELLLDPVKMVDVIYALCKPSADAIGITEEQFGTGLVGDHLGAAIDAFIDALCSFFPQRQRMLLQKLWVTNTQMLNSLAKTAADQLDALIATSCASN